jgi:ATP-binding cassette subfamily B protein
VIGAFVSKAAKPPGKWEFIFSAYSVWVIIFVIIISIILEVKRINTMTAKDIEATDARKQINRIKNYYFDYLYSYKWGKDLRLYDLAPSLTEEIRGINETTADIQKNVWRNRMKFESFGSVIATVMSSMTYGYIAIKALFGAFPIGSVVQYIGAITRFNESITWLCGHSLSIWDQAITLKMYFDFLDMPDKKRRGTLTVEKRQDNDYEIEFRNVSFKYPGVDTYALKNLSLKLIIGQKHAVVGVNGSGKTTMIKLLCRLYDPTDGEITLNGIDIKKYDYNEYLDIFSVVFQDFKLFSFPLGENVAASTDVDYEKAEKCLQMANFSERISLMPKGLDTPIYKDFEEDGLEISGGEAQKIALARALYKDAPFIVLDEPTAALDPIAEFEIYSTFNEIVGEKTAIYISHRLSSCRFCDNITVFHEGEVVQRGNHDLLIEDKNGKYYELWNAQAQYYT